MPALPPDSSDSPPPSVTPSSEGAALRLRPASVRPLSWRTNAFLFVATVASMFVTWCDPRSLPSRAVAIEAAQFTGTLSAILLAHEFGHYIAARVHKVDASLPYFIPLPILSPFGTMGAVIRMRSLIPTRRALLDIGAAGPLAGLVLAIPAYALGIAHSQPVVPDASGGIELGNSLLSMLLDHWFAPAIPAGMELKLSPIAYAGWAGMFVTMINLLPVGQLDGGHVAFSLFGPRQNRIAQWVHRSMLVFFFVSVASFVVRDVRGGLGLWQLGHHVNDSLLWLVWFEVLAMLGSVSRGREAAEDDVSPLSLRTRGFATLGLALLAGAFHDNASVVLWAMWFVGLGVLLAMEIRWGALRASSTLVDHPATGPEPLTAGRAAVAILTLLFFVLLFMPTPISL